MIRKLLQGIIVPTITPLTLDGALDIAGLERLVDHLLRGEVNGLFIAGTTGEGPALSYEIRRDMLSRVSKQVSGRIPVVVAAMDSSPAETMRMIAHAADTGVAAVAIAPPFYMPVSQSDLVRYGRAVAQASPLPVYLYNVPNANLPRFTLDTLSQLSELDNVLGFKDSGGSLEFLLTAIRLFEKRPETSVLVGPENLLVDSIRAGGDGGVSGGGNLFPRLYTELYKASVQGDWKTADALHCLILRVHQDFYRVGESESSLIRGMKVTASLMGICGATLVPPYARATPEETAAVAVGLARFQDDLAQELRLLGDSPRSPRSV